jgi:class 3 adenylate cyclase
MHAGIHSGQFHFFLLGESQRELLVTGPSATRTVEMEAASEAGEIVLSPETAAVLPAAAVGEEKGPGLLLQGDPEGTGTPAPLPEVADELIERALPVAIRAQLLEGGPLESEHRNAALAFIRFSGVDEVLRSEGPDAVADALEALVNAIESAAVDHGVAFLESDVDRDGGRIILAAERRRRSATTRSASADARSAPSAVCPGSHRFAGRVRGPGRAPFRRTYTVLGITPRSPRG